MKVSTTATLAPNAFAKDVVNSKFKIHQYDIFIAFK